MQEPDNLTGLYEDRLSDALKEYVFGLLPESEYNTGIAVEFFTTFTRYLNLLDGVPQLEIVEMEGYGVATLTDQYLRLHYLDYCWEPSEAGYAYFDRARQQENRPFLYLYDSALKKFGKRYCHLPNLIWLIEIPRDEMTFVEMKLEPASEAVKQHLLDNHWIDIEKHPVITVETRKSTDRVCSVYKAITQVSTQLAQLFDDE